MVLAELHICKFKMIPTMEIHNDCKDNESRNK